MKKLSLKLRKQKEKSTIAIIKDKNDTLHRGKSKIAACFRGFYQDLYASELNGKEIWNYLKQLSLPLVTKEQNNNLVEPITEVEIVKVIHKSKTGRRPGSDEFTDEFYKEFKHIILPVLGRVFNDILETGEWPMTWNTAVISVIHKEGKDPENCTSYRPISLISDILPELINFDQILIVYLVITFKRHLTL